MAWEVLKAIGELAVEASKEVPKKMPNGVIDVRKPVEPTIMERKNKVAPKEIINLDKRIPRDVSKIKNNVFEINGYKYTTDKLGRPISAEGNLKLDPSSRDLNAQKRAGGKDRLKTDDGGHPIGSQFGGAGDRFLIAQDATLNRGPYKALENKWASAVKNGDKVFVKVDMSYPGKSMRPDSIRVNYSINGEKFKTTFSNKPSAYAK